MISTQLDQVQPAMLLFMIILYYIAANAITEHSTVIIVKRATI